MKYNSNQILAVVLSAVTVGSFAMVADVGAEPLFPPQYISTTSADQIVASFERDFDHQLVPAAPVASVAIDGDVLYELVNKALQSEDDAQARQVNLIAGVGE